MTWYWCHCGFDEDCVAENHRVEGFMTNESEKGDQIVGQEARERHVRPMGILQE